MFWAKVSCSFPETRLPRTSVTCPSPSRSPSESTLTLTLEQANGRTVVGEGRLLLSGDASTTDLGNVSAPIEIAHDTSLTLTVAQVSARTVVGEGRLFLSGDGSFSDFTNVSPSLQIEVAPNATLAMVLADLATKSVTPSENLTKLFDSPMAKSSSHQSMKSYMLAIGKSRSRSKIPNGAICSSKDRHSTFPANGFGTLLSPKRHQLVTAFLTSPIPDISPCLPPFSASCRRWKPVPSADSSLRKRSRS